MWCVVSVIKLKNKIFYRRRNLLIIQKNVRMYLAKKIYKPRYTCIMKLKKLCERLDAMSKIAGQLTKEKDKSFTDIQNLGAKIRNTILQIKESNVNTGDLEKNYSMYVTAVDNLLINLEKKLQQQKIAEEQARIKKIQDDMERERIKKEEELRKKAEEEELRRRKMDLELQRKKEEECRIKAERENIKQMKEYEAELILQQEEEVIRQRQLQQEHTDHELALRLAQDINGVDEVVTPPPLPRSPYVLQQKEQLAAKKHDLSKWKYSELRDTINTSCDLDLLEACREEFHRRLKVYHSWKLKNLQKSGVQNRAPESIMQPTKTAPLPPKRISSLGQNSATDRYFRIPFVRNSAQKGWWYAHFHGQWISRQMELHPDKPPIQLVAGKDDMQMCELSLDETGLAQKRGAEILEEEFKTVWEKHAVS